MYQINDFVSYGTRGVCKIVNITKLDMPGSNPDQLYFCLSPLANSWNTIYTPVGNEAAFKPLVSREEAITILKELPDIEPCPAMGRFQLDQTFKQMMQENDPRSLISLIKYLHNVRIQRITSHKKINASIQRYLADAKHRLIEILCIPLGQDTKQLEQVVQELLV